MKRALIDSGPLIALFDNNDSYYPRAIDFLRSFQGQLISNSAVLTEVTHLLDFSLQAQVDFLQWVAKGGLTLVEITKADLIRIVELVKQYSDLPADFADASLVAIAERLKIQEVVSIDKDFTVYRIKGMKAFRNLFPR